VKVLSGDFYEIKNLVLDFDICTMIFIKHALKIFHFPPKFKAILLAKHKIVTTMKERVNDITHPLGFQKNWHYVN
jgi:hypothetical protein